MIRFGNGVCLLGVLSLVALISGCPPPDSARITVNTLSDVADGDMASLEALRATPGADGLISLREAITAANNSEGLQRIRFSVAGVIEPLTPLPAIADNTGGIDLDGAGVISLAGTQSVAKGDRVFDAGLTLNSADNTIRGLAIYDFERFCILIDGEDADNNTIQGCLIGTDGVTAYSDNTGDGVFIYDGASGNLIGGDTIASRNVISGNGDSGIFISEYGSDNNVVMGNYIGVSPDGTTAMANRSGVYLGRFTEKTIIGGPMPGEGNVISGNELEGITMTARTHGNIVQGNLIGTNAAGTAAIPNGRAGIQMVSGALDNRIGGSGPGEGNVISGNVLSGIEITDTGTDFNVVQGNHIGVDITGMSPIPNLIDGVQIRGGASENLIGGIDESAANIIAANTMYGVRLSLSSFSNQGVVKNNTIQGNLIGDTVPGLGNGMDGILIEGLVQSTLVGGVMPFAKNIIRANGMYGIRLNGPVAVRNELRQNTFEANTLGPVRLQAGANGEVNTPEGEVDIEDARVQGQTDRGAVVEIYTQVQDGPLEYLDFTIAGTGGTFTYWHNPMLDSTLRYFAAATDFYGDTSEFGELEVVVP